MKKLLSTLVAALVAVSFAGIVLAAEPMKAAEPAAPAAGEMKKDEMKPMKEKKMKKVKKAKKAKTEMKKEEAPAMAPAAK